MYTWSSIVADRHLCQEFSHVLFFRGIGSKKLQEVFILGCKLFLLACWAFHHASVRVGPWVWWVGLQRHGVMGTLDDELFGDGESPPPTPECVSAGTRGVCRRLGLGPYRRAACGGRMRWCRGVLQGGVRLGYPMRHQGVSCLAGEGMTHLDLVHGIISCLPCLAVVLWTASTGMWIPFLELNFCLFVACIVLYRFKS